MREDWFRQTEKMLYSRKYWDTAIADLAREVEATMPQSSFSVIKMGGGDGGNGDITSHYAVERAEGPAARRLNELKRKREAVRAAKQGLSGKENTLLRMKYDLEHTDRYIHRQMGMRWEDYAEFKRGVLVKVARGLGIIEREAGC